MRAFFFIIVYFIAKSQFAQTPADWWYFGHFAGMHFTSSGPVAVNDGALYTGEGCASISSHQGQLLFYTDGTRVYNNQHDTMPHGHDLMGNASSTQSAIIVPRPQHPSQYYVFTVACCTAPDGLRYSVVDMSLDGGLGDIDTNEKNIPIITPVGEKITAVAKPGGYWVITHKLPGDTIYSYSVTAAGVNLTPVTSSMNVSSSEVANFVGYMKASPSGDKIALVCSNSSPSGAYVMDFDNVNGVVSNAVTINCTAASANYGIEFSPNGNVLYVRGWGPALTQYDLSLGTSSAISASEYAIPRTSGGHVQLGPDGKIYVSNAYSTVMSVINQPDSLGFACDFQDTALLLSDYSTYGLPTFVQTFFKAFIEFKDVCLGDSTFFSIDTTGIDSYLWDFGDPGSGSLNQSAIPNPSHYFADTGYYTIRLIIAQDTVFDTAYQEIYIYPRQSVDLGSDIISCNGDSVIFSVSQLYASYLWQDGTTSDSIIVVSDSIISVTVYGVCDTVSDTITVSFDLPIQIDLPNDTSFCDSNEFILDANIQVRIDSVWWNTGQLLDSIHVRNSGFYKITAFNECGSASDSIAIKFIPVPNSIILPDDTINCFDNAFVLVRPDDPNSTYYWSDSSTNKTFTIDTTETIWLTWFNECGFVVDTFNAIFNGEIKTELGEDTIICPNDSIVLNAHWNGATYLWNTSDTTDSIFTELDLTKLYVVTITYNFCSTIDSRWVTVDELVCPDINCTLQHPNTITPNGDGLNDRFRAESDCGIYYYKMTIWNSWGQIVSQTDNVAFGWDGYINGKPASPGVYYFLIDLKDRVVVDEDRNSYRGAFQLLR